jgi:hypothetical protein
LTHVSPGQRSLRQFWHQVFSLLCAWAPSLAAVTPLGGKTVAFHQQKKGFTSKNQQTLGLNMQKVAFTTENRIATSGY